jgi:nicotinamidase-related amidase
MIEVDLARHKPVVVVTDVQELFTAAEGPFENTTSGPLLEALDAFLRACRALAVPVVFSNYIVRDDRLDAGLLRDAPWVAAGHLGAGSPWVRVDRRLERAPSDVEVRHNRPSAFFRSELDAVLAGLGADALVLCGLSVNNAISATARDAFARDLPTIVVRECTGAAPWETEHDTYFDILATWTAEVASAENVLARLRAA